MFINIIFLIIQSLAVIITLISVILIYKTIKSNESLNQRILFNNITKEERELRIKLLEYNLKIEDSKTTEKEKQTLILAHDTLLFNYYEYLSICLIKRIIRENDAKLYFKDLLKNVKAYFDTSLLFEEESARKQEYPGIQWLFRKWGA